MLTVTNWEEKKKSQCPRSKDINWNIVEPQLLSSSLIYFQNKFYL